MGNIEKPKVISAYIMRPLAVSGDGCRIHYIVLDNGVIIIEKRMFFNDPGADWQVVRKIWGKCYCKQSMSFKYRTLGRIINIATQDLLYAGVKREDIA